MRSPEPPLGAAWHAIHVHTAVVWIPLGGAAGFSDSPDQAMSPSLSGCQKNSDHWPVCRQSVARQYVKGMPSRALPRLATPMWHQGLSRFGWRGDFWKWEQSAQRDSVTTLGIRNLLLRQEVVSFLALGLEQA